MKTLTIKDIEAYKSYYGDNKFKTVTIFKGPRWIGNKAFMNSDNLHCVKISETIQIIGENAFSNCKHLKNVFLSDSIISIKDYAFSNCKDIKEIVIPDSVTWIGDSGGIVYTLVKSSNTRYTVGVHHGRSEDGQLAIYSKADNVLNTLGVERY